MWAAERGRLSNVPINSLFSFSISEENSCTEVLEFADTHFSVSYAFSLSFKSKEKVNKVEHKLDK